MKEVLIKIKLRYIPVIVIPNKLLWHISMCVVDIRVMQSFESFVALCI